MGRVSFQADLAGPEIPETLEYLYRYLLELHGRSGVGMSGLAPLSFSTIAEWSRLKGVSLNALEVEGLLFLDAIMLSPTEDKNVG